MNEVPLHWKTVNLAGNHPGLRALTSPTTQLPLQLKTRATPAGWVGEVAARVVVGEVEGVSACVRACCEDVRVPAAPRTIFIG